MPKLKKGVRLKKGVKLKATKTKKKSIQQRLKERRKANHTRLA